MDNRTGAARSRREFLAFSGVGAAGAALRAAAGRTAGRADKCNFLFILTDDQRYDAMGCAGNRLIHTPNLDALARRGVRFERAFVTLSICSPSRAACLTGRYGSRNGVTALGQALRKGERTFAHHLKAAGYQTGFVGKWHLRDRPEACGFDYATYFEGNGPHYNRRVTTGARRHVADGYVEDYLAGRSVEFMRAASDAGRPFVLWHCTQVPHMTPRFNWDARDATLARYDERKMPVPVTWRDDLAGKPPYLKDARFRTRARTYGYERQEAIRKHARRYYAAVTDVDAAMGRVLAALDRLNLRESTYVFFLGDNGWMLGDHGLTSKVLPYEPSARVPMIVAGPGIAPRVEGRLVLNADVAPTLLELAGLPVPANLHGRSLMPLLRGTQTAWRKSVLYEAPTAVLGSRPLLAVRTDRWKYVRTFDGKTLAAGAEHTFEELYDLQTDPNEMTNLAGRSEHAAAQKRLATELTRLRGELKA